MRRKKTFLSHCHIYFTFFQLLRKSQRKKNQKVDQPSKYPVLFNFVYLLQDRCESREYNQECVDHEPREWNNCTAQTPRKVLRFESCNIEDPFYTDDRMTTKTSTFPSNGFVREYKKVDRRIAVNGLYTPSLSSDYRFCRFGLFQKFLSPTQKSLRRSESEMYVG